MNFGKISRIPKRIRQDLKIISLAENWKEILSAKITQAPLFKIKLRNGMIINSPAEINLNFLFHEIWLDEVYLAKGYEIKPNDIVLDIGANIGVFAFYAAMKEPNAKVYSYEPFPKNAEYFEQNLTESKIKNVVFYKLAIANAAGERILHIHESWIKHSLSENSSETEGVIVHCISLNEALETFPQCNLLKLDCEGSEYEILYSSSPETLNKIKKIVGEFHNLDNKEKNGESLRKFLEENSFQIDVFQPLDKSSGLICAKKQ